MGIADFRVLSLSVLGEDSAWLSTIRPPLPWKVASSASLESAMVEMAACDVAVVLCDADSDPSLWRDVLAECQRISKPPYLIVTSRLADDRLWAEALNLGAYDVLAKPFDSREVWHALTRAFTHWLTPAPMPLKTAFSNNARTAAA